MAEPLDDLDALRRAVAEHRAEGKKIISHFKKMEDAYSDWEDRLIQIEKAIEEAEQITGIAKEEIINTKDIVDELLG